MGLRYNPFNGSFDFTRSPGSYLDGEVATFADLPLDTAAAPLNSAWLVREASGLWLVNRKPAGIYIRTATGGTDRNADYTYASAFPDVFSDANFTLYDDADSTKNAKFSLGNLTTGTTRTLTVPDKSGTIATTDAGDLTSGTLADARLSSNVPLRDAANTYSANQTLNGTNNVAPNQTAASASSLMTRMLADLRYGAWSNTHEITNFTGATAGVVSGGSTTIGSGFTQLRGASGGGYRSIQTIILAQTTQAVGTIAAGGWLSQAVFSLANDNRCNAAFFPILGTLSAQWAGRAPGIFISGAVVPYFLFRSDSWRAVKATFVRGSSSVFPARASNVVTVTTNGNHGLVAGDFVAIGGVAPQSMQTVRAEVTSAPTSTTFTYANTGADETATTILGDNMHIWKIEELGSIAASVSSNLFTDPRTWQMSVELNPSGGGTFIANGTTVATGTGFTVSEMANTGRAGFFIETLSTSTNVTDLFVYKLRHTVNP